MPVGLPAKTTYANGDVFSASDINDTNGTINLIGQTQNFYAGKNKIINGDFGIWQRGTSITPVSGYGFGPDRFQTYSYGTSTTTISRQTFTPGAAPVSGYESQYFCRILSTNTSAALEHRVEDVRTISQGSWTISFWAKSASAQTLTGSVNYFYGTGGSSQETLSLTMPAITTSWARYSITFTAGSYTGKTIGANSWFGLVIAGAINNNLDIWGVQIEAGSTATAFETATGTIQGELAACQRYYWQHNGSTNVQYFSNAFGYNSTSLYGVMKLPVTMRSNPSFSAVNPTAGLAWNATTILTATSITMTNADPNSPLVLFTFASGVSSNQSSMLGLGNTGVMQFSAEL